jgi:hypothetical protein
MMPTDANPKALIIFAHGSGSGKNSSRNQYVSCYLNENGFATLLTDLLTLEEQHSDIKSQRILEKYPSIILNKFNIKLLSNRLVLVTNRVLEQIEEVRDLSIGYFDSSTGGRFSYRSF